MSEPFMAGYPGLRGRGYLTATQTRGHYLRSLESQPSLRESDLSELGLHWADSMPGPGPALAPEYALLQPQQQADMTCSPLPLK